MTIEIRVERFTADELGPGLFQYLRSHEYALAGCDAKGMTSKVFDAVCEWFVERLNEASALWPQRFILLSSRTALPTTRITRRYKLWEHFAKYEIPAAARTPMFELQTAEHLEFFAAVDLAKLPPAIAKHLLWNEPRCYLVALPSHEAIAKYASIGWIGDWTEDTHLIVSLLRAGALVARKVGAFDDRERGLMFLTATKQMEAFLPS